MAIVMHEMGCGIAGGECTCGASAKQDEREAPRTPAPERKSNPFDPDTLSASLAIRPADVRAHVAALRTSVQGRTCSKCNLGDMISQHPNGSHVCDRCKRRLRDPNTVRPRAIAQAQCFVAGYDPGAGEDVTALVIMEKQHDGSHRVAGVRTWTRPDDRSPQDRPALYELIMKGWKCTACGVFCGEEKELLLTCRSCDAPRPVGHHAPKESADDA